MGDPFRKIYQAERQINRAANAPGQKLRRFGQGPRQQVRSVRNQGRRIVRSPQQQARQLKARGQRLRQAPQRQARRMKAQGQRVANAPKRQAQSFKQQGRRLANTPNRQQQQVKGRVSRFKQLPNRNLRKAQKAASSSDEFGKIKGYRRYQRRPDRMLATDFTVSALLYPFGILLGWFAGSVEDWDTAYIHWHLAHAQVFSMIALIFMPFTIILTIMNPVWGLIPFFPLIFYWLLMWILGFLAFSGNFTIVPFVTKYLDRRKMLDFDTIEQMLTRPHYSAQQSAQH